MRTAAQERARYNGLKIRHVAEELGVSGQHVRNLMKQGELEAVDVSIGKVPEYRISLASFEAFMERRRVA